MKNQIPFALILILLAGLACQLTPTPPPAAPVPSSTATRTPVPPTPTQTPVPSPTAKPPLNSPNGPPLISIHMFTPQQGWGVMDTDLLLTMDGGFTWYSVPIPGVIRFVGSLASCFFQNEKTAYILFPAPNGKSGILLFSQDTGQTWERIPVPASNGQVQFMRATNLEGFIFQDLGTTADSEPVAIYQTLDQLSWLPTFIHTTGASTDPSNLPMIGVKTGMFFNDSNHGWISGSTQTDNTIYFFHTEDAGRHWKHVDLPLPDGLGPVRTISYPAQFPTTSDGYLPVDITRVDNNTATRAFYATHDSGTTWELASSLPLASSLSPGNIIQFANATSGWSWGGGKLYFTSDSAKTWIVLPVPFGRNEVLTQMDFIDVNNGWVLTVDQRSRVRLYNSKDGGNTWTIVIP